MVFHALQKWLSVHPDRNNRDAPLFLSGHTRNKALTVSSVNRLVKSWCAQASLNENYGSHTLRKTWGYHQRVGNNASVAKLMKAFGHSSETQTLEYLGILATEVYALYMEYEI